MLTSDIFEGDVKTAVNAVFFSYLIELSRDVFIKGEVERSKGC